MSTDYWFLFQPISAQAHAPIFKSKWEIVRISFFLFLKCWKRNLPRLFSRFGKTFSVFLFRAKIEMGTALITLRQNILIHLPFILLNCVTELFTRCRTKFPSLFPKSGSRSVSHFGMNCRTWLCPYRAVHLLVFLAHKVIFTGELKDKSSVLSEKAEQHLISHS